MWEWPPHECSVIKHLGMFDLNTCDGCMDVFDTLNATNPGKLNPGNVMYEVYGTPHTVTAKDVAMLVMDWTVSPK